MLPGGQTSGAQKFKAVIKRRRFLVREPHLATVVIQLLKDREEKQVVSRIHELWKSSISPPSFSGLTLHLCRFLVSIPPRLARFLQTPKLLEAGVTHLQGYTVK